jgi:hypothetical protein
MRAAVLAFWEVSLGMISAGAETAPLLPPLTANILGAGDVPSPSHHLLLAIVLKIAHADGNGSEQTRPMG